MGYTSSSADDLRARAAYRSASGTKGAYDAATRAAPPSARKVHPSLDPKWTNKDGIQVRECRDSAEHQLTLPVVVGFDETGSMGHAAFQMQEKLATLKGASLRAGLADAQLLFGAYGDGQNGEVAPCQVGQFESGLEMEEWLNNLYIEGNGGGNSGETAGLFLYFMANYSKLDSVEKRGKKGYLILTGDEVPLPKITKHEREYYIGEDGVQGDIPVEEVVAKAKESYEIYFFMVNNGAAKMQGSEKRWGELLGPDHLIVVEDLDTISEQIAILIARCEGLIDSVDDGIAMLMEEGVSEDDARKAGSALVPLDKVVGTVAQVAETEGELPEALDAAGDVERL